MPFSFSPARSKLSACLIWIALTCFIFFFEFHYHEFWKDEWQSWLVARDMSWQQMFGFLYYEGHPALWYVYLKLFVIIRQLFSLSSDDHILIVAHLLLLSATLFILFLYFRMPLLLKIAVSCSYFLLFEYGIVNRGYILIALIAFLIAVTVKKKKLNFKLLAVLIFLLCQTEAYGVIMAFAFVLYILLKENAFNFSSLKKKSFRLLGVSLAVGVFVFIISVFPRGNADELARAYNPTKQPITQSMGESFQGILANTFLTGLTSDPNVYGISEPGIFFSILILMLLILLFKNQKSVLSTFLFFLAAFYLFSVVFYSGGLRQWGIGFIFFIVALELLPSGRKKLNPLQLVIIALILVCQARYSYLAFQKDYQYPFSNSKAVAEFINENVPVNVPIIAINKFASTPVIGYSNRIFYSLPEGEPFTYFRWLEKIYEPTENELILFARYKQTGGLIIVTSEPLPPKRYPHTELWKTFDTFNLKAENYWVYVLSLRKME